MAMAQQARQAVEKRGHDGRTTLWPMRPFAEMEQLLMDVLQRPLFAPLRMGGLPEPMGSFGDLVPRIDVIDRDSELLVRVELPGVRKEDVELSLAGNVMSVKGHAHREHEEERGDYYRRETATGSFQRTLTLPAEVDQAHATAHLEDGVLEVTLPKIAAAVKRTVDID